jgi:hypothetical protein
VARWSAVGGGIAALCLLPALVGAVPVDARSTQPDARATLARAVAASDTAHKGLAEVRGTLGLPDVPRLETATQLLGDRTRVRVWWRSADAWRVAVLRPAGERDVYKVRDAVVEYDYERAESRTTIGDAPVRLPRAHDLVPPQLVGRLLRSVTPQDRVTSLEERRVGGRAAVGLRVEPADRRSTIGAIDVWADDSSGLPLRVEVRGRGASRPALVSEYLAVDVVPPSDRDLYVRIPPEASSQLADDADIIARFDRRARWRLPDTVGGLARSADVERLSGTGAYGVGFVRVFVVPLSPFQLRRAIDDASEAQGTDAERFPNATAVFFRTSLLTAGLVAADDGEHAYMIAGTVDETVLRTVATALLDDPPEPR